MLCLWPVKQRSFKLVTRRILYLFIVQFWQYLPWKQSLLWCYCCWLDRQITCQSKYVGGIVMRASLFRGSGNEFKFLSRRPLLSESQSDSVQRKVLRKLETLSASLKSPRNRAPVWISHLPVRCSCRWVTASERWCICQRIVRHFSLHFRRFVGIRYAAAARCN